MAAITKLKQCTALSEAGQRCKRIAIGGDFCPHHKANPPERVADSDYREHIEPNLVFEGRRPQTKRDIALLLVDTAIAVITGKLDKSQGNSAAYILSQAMRSGALPDGDIGRKGFLKRVAEIHEMGLADLKEFEIELRDSDKAISSE